MFVRKKEILLIVLTVILFILSSYFSTQYADYIKEFVLMRSFWGVLVYILVMIAAVIVAPFETLPLLPLASAIWGPNQAAIFTIIGWTIGSLIAFSVARRFGQRFVRKFVNIKKDSKWKSLAKTKNLFWLVAFARFFLPIDVISYAVGIFTSMHWFKYLIATLIGVIPFAFLFTYGSEINLSWQAFIGIVVLIVIITNYKKIKNLIKPHKKALDMVSEEE